MKEIITKNFKETQRLGEELALRMEGGEVICLEGELGAGKTTFTQGLLKGLGAEGPYTSPTFLIMKQYDLKTKNHPEYSGLKAAYHIDAYRVGADDILNLGWEEMIADPKNIIIVEWPERIKEILPENVLKISFESLDEDRRKITFSV